jgi:hypothetical protein
MGLFKGQDPDSIKPFGDLMMYRHKGTFEKIKGINKFALEREWGLFCTKYISSREPHLRVVMLSKAAAKMFRFDPRFMIGDDTVNYLDYKWAHCQGLIKLAHLFDSEPTYVYDCRCGGVTADKNNDGWMKKLMVEFRKREQEGTVFDKKIPRIKINKDGSLGDSWDITWPEGYIPDVCGLPKPKQHEQYWN